MPKRRKVGGDSTKTVSTTTHGKTRDQYPTWVRGISAPVEFWTAIKDYGQSRGLNRSAAIVELVQQALGKKAQFSAANVGRPRKKTVKVQQ